MKYKILYDDENYTGIYKPSGIPVHKSNFHRRGLFLLQELRNQLGRRIYPVHRLDQAASGVMIFAHSSVAASAFSRLMKDGKINKEYLVMTRGFAPESCVIDTPFITSGFESRDAMTLFRRLAILEIDAPTGKYQTSRYSLITVRIETGRRHQIRRHLARISHPVIGDSIYGDLRHNKSVNELSGFRRLMLFSAGISFLCPFSGDKVIITSCPDKQIMDFFEKTGWSEYVFRRVEALNMGEFSGR